MKSPSTPSTPEIPRRVPDIAGAPRRRPGEDEATAATPASAPSRPSGMPANPAAGQAMAAEPAQAEKPASERRLIVGKEISLAGEINACDHLVVEGRIEAKLKDCRIIEVSDSGVFKGSADIGEADIAGQFDGDLSVSGRLKVRGSGTISGNIRYGQIEVESGGRLIGTVQPLDSTPAATIPPKPSAPAAAPATTEPAAPPTSGVVHSLSEAAGDGHGQPGD